MEISENRFTPRAQAALRLAQESSAQLGHGYVGSEHAYFLCREDGVYLVDNNSMNHTWLNGQMLPANQPQPVKPGDVIKMADEELDVLPG